MVSPMSFDPILRGLKGISAGDMPLRKAAPVDVWNPEFSAPIDIRIDKDGNWFHEGAPIARAALVALFASVLRREPDGQYVLVTPAERRFIEVEDVPFVGIGIEASGSGAQQDVKVRTNLGDEVIVSDDYQLEMRENRDVSADTALAYVRIRGGLEARFNRATFLELAELACVEQVQGARWFGVWSSGSFWKLLRAEDVGL